MKPQKAHPSAERRHMTYRLSKSVHRCDLCRRDQKKKERQRNIRVANWVFAETTQSSDRTEILHGGWSSDRRSKVRISSKSVKQFRSCGGRNLPIPIDLGMGMAYTTSCSTVQAMIKKEKPTDRVQATFFHYKRLQKARIKDDIVL